MEEGCSPLEHSLMNRCKGLETDIDDLKYDCKKLTQDLKDSREESLTRMKERDGAYSERNEARECEEDWHNAAIQKDLIIERLTKKLQYCYNKAYILQHTPVLEQCRNDIWKLWDAVEEFKPVSTEEKK